MGKPGTKMWRQEQATGLADDLQNRKNFLASYAASLEGNGDPEQAYRAAAPIDHRKRFGQFFTPVPVADLMVEWIEVIRPRSILDPAVGPGVFPRILSATCPDAHSTCLDIDPLALDAARLALPSTKKLTFIEQDFLLWNDDLLFDAAIANPPYLRHHDLNYPFDIFHLVGKKNHIQLSRLSNIYVLFILEVCRRLRVGGRAAIIVPGEWVNANFGDQLKLWLVSRGLLHTLLYFSHMSSQFEDALTTASILLLEKPQPHTGRQSIRTIFVNDGAPLEDIRRIMDETATGYPEIIVRNFSPERLLEEKKWNHLLAHGSEVVTPGFVKLGELAKTRRGIATGSNSFFHISLSTAVRFAIRRENLKQCVGRALDVPGAVFRKTDFAKLVADDRRTYLFDMQSEPNEAEGKYIAQGESDALDKRYLCAARNGKWYRMEQRPPSAIWATVFGRKGLRFIHNPDSIANLTTFHCIYPVVDAPIFAAALTACLNSRVVQDLARRQHRVYGGGLLKVEPKDLLDIEVPDLRRVAPTTLRVLAGLLGRLDAAIRSVEHTEYGVKSALDALDYGAVNASQEAASAYAQESSLRKRLEPTNQSRELTRQIMLQAGVRGKSGKLTFGTP
jgi:adenine-specific DNA-methyltransferase